MNFENLRKILSIVDKNTSINKDNVINEIKKVSQKEGLSTYQEWKNKNFDINYVFTQSDSNAKFTLLITAAANGHKDVVNALLDRDADVHIEDENKETALHYAAYSNSAEIIDALLDRGANINAKNKDTWTSLHIAAYYGYKDVVNALLDRGANINERESYHSALHYAAANGHIEVVNALLAKGANIHEKNNLEKTPLRYAAANGHVEIVDALLAKGANVHEKDNLGKTPLHCAAANGHVEIVNTLLDRGANVYEKDEQQKSSLYYAIRNYHGDVVKDIRQFLKKKAVQNSATVYCFAVISGVAIAGALFATGIVRMTKISTAIATAIVEVAALTIGYAKYEISRINDEIKEIKELENVNTSVHTYDVRYISMESMLSSVYH